MDPITETPTEAVDYAALSLLYGSLLAGTAYSAAGRDPIGRAELVPLSAATFALSKLLVHEKVETWVRLPFVEETADGKRPKGRRLRYAVGELLQCTRCVGAWSALSLIALRTHAPGPARTVTTVLAVSAGNDFLHSAFSMLCARSSSAKREAEHQGSLSEELRELMAARQAA